MSNDSLALKKPVGVVFGANNGSLAYTYRCDYQTDCVESVESNRIFLLGRFLIDKFLFNHYLKRAIHPFPIINHITFVFYDKKGLSRDCVKKSPSILSCYSRNVGLLLLAFSNLLYTLFHLTKFSRVKGFKSLFIAFHDKG